MCVLVSSWSRKKEGRKKGKTKSALKCWSNYGSVNPLYSAAVQSHGESGPAEIPMEQRREEWVSEWEVGRGWGVEEGLGGAVVDTSGCFLLRLRGKAVIYLGSVLQFHFSIVAEGSNLNYSGGSGP